MPETRKFNYKIHFPLIILFLTYLLFSIPYSPFFENLGYDKEIFQYIGMLIKNNQYPYSDVFDHKPPIIYILNYLGVLLTPKSTWGIFLIINTIGFFSSILLYQLASKKFNKILIPTIISILFISFINSNSILQGGNLTRQLTTFLNTAIIFLVLGTKKTNLTQGLLGFIISLIFFTQQNEILSGSVLIAYNLIFRKSFIFYSLKKILSNIVFFTIGLLIPTIGIFLIINHWNNYHDFINQAFLFNLNSYIDQRSLLIKIIAIVNKFFVILNSNKSLLIIVFLSIINIIFNRIYKIKTKPKLTILIIAFAFQILSSSISGKIYSHYFLMFIPYVVSIFIISFNQNNHRFSKYILYVLLGVATLISLKNISYKKNDEKLMEIVLKQVESLKNTPGQFYSFNAKYLRVNFNLNITSPSKYIYLHFNQKEQFVQLIKDFRKYNTKYILYNPKSNNLPKELKSYISSNYIEKLNYKGDILYEKTNNIYTQNSYK